MADPCSAAAEADPCSAAADSCSAAVEADADCGICLDGIEDNGTGGAAPATLDQCSHEFHFACIVQWGSNNNVCPFCRANFTVVINKVTGIQTNVGRKRRQRPTVEGTDDDFVIEDYDSDASAAGGRYRRGAAGRQGRTRARCPPSNCILCSRAVDPANLLVCSSRFCHSQLAVHTSCLGLADRPVEPWTCGGPNCPISNNRRDLATLVENLGEAMILDRRTDNHRATRAMLPRLIYLLRAFREDPTELANSRVLSKLCSVFCGGSQGDSSPEAHDTRLQLLQELVQIVPKLSYFQAKDSLLGIAMQRCLRSEGEPQQNVELEQRIAVQLAAIAQRFRSLSLAERVKESALRQAVSSAAARNLELRMLPIAARAGQSAALSSSSSSGARIADEQRPIVGQAKPLAGKRGLQLPGSMRSVAPERVGASAVHSLLFRTATSPSSPSSTSFAPASAATTTASSATSSQDDFKQQREEPTPFRSSKERVRFLEQTVYILFKTTLRESKPPESISYTPFQDQARFKAWFKAALRFVVKDNRSAWKELTEKHDAIFRETAPLTAMEKLFGVSGQDRVFSQLHLALHFASQEV